MMAYRRSRRYAPRKRPVRARAKRPVRRRAAPRARRFLPELKIRDVDLTWNTLTASTLFFLSGMAQGVGESERVGMSYDLTSVSMRLSFIWNGTAVAPGTVNRFRMVVFKDKSTQGAGATPADLFESPTDIQSFRQRDLNKRFTILKDTVIQIDPNRLAQKYMDVNIKCPMNIRSSGTTNTLASFQQNGLFVMFLMARDASAANEILVAGTARVRYRD